MYFRENLLFIMMFSFTIIRSIYKYCSIKKPSFKPIVAFRKGYNNNPIYFKKVYTQFCIYSLIGSIIGLSIAIWVRTELLLDSYILLLAILVIPSSIFFIKLKSI